MAERIPPGFIAQIPKTDLHLHLDGSLRLSSLIDMARATGVALPSQEEAGLRERVFKDRYRDLPEYLAGFRYTCAVLQNEENLERAACELAEDCLAENVRYIEVRFAPQLHVRKHLGYEQVLRAVARGLERAATAHNRGPGVTGGDDVPFAFGLIVCAMRRFSAEMGAYFAGLIDRFRFAPPEELYAAASLEMVRAAVAIRDETGLPIVGFDLAGEEAGYPAGAHRAAYAHAHRNFLLKTVHAGEAYGPESIFQAITVCHANRIGHGTFLFDHRLVRDTSIADPRRYVEQLAEYLANRRITVEVCLTSNLQTTPGIARVADHPVRQMIGHGLSVCLCTDNRLVSHTTATRELQRLAEHVPLTREQFRNLVVAGFKGAFFPGPYREKRGYVRRVLDRYEAIERDWAKEIEGWH